MHRPSHLASRFLVGTLALLAGLVLYILAIPPVTYLSIMHDGKKVFVDRPWLKTFTRPIVFIEQYPPFKSPLNAYCRWWMVRTGYDGWEENELRKLRRRR